LQFHCIEYRPIFVEKNNMPLYLFLFLIVYFFFVFFLRSFLVWKRTDVNPWTFSKVDDAHGYNGKVFTLLLLSLVLVWVAQSQMANSWRIGIDEKNKTELVTNGLFSVSRNPIFLGIVIVNFGLFLIIPNAFTLLILSLSMVSINTQIRLEEAFLKTIHGNAYEQYLGNVRRWI